jgi:lipoprotein-releasing system permease protein
MTSLPVPIAFAHLRARKRQTAVSIGGVMLGVAVFIGIGGMMNGFHHYFLSQLVDTNPHIVVTDEIRRAAPQPLAALYPDAAVEIRRVLPRDPVRGISGAAAILDSLNAMDGVAAAPSLVGQLILRHAGRDYSLTGIGVDAPREVRVTDIVHDMVEGSVEALASNPDGLVIGRQLADKMGVGLGDGLAAVTTAGTQTTLKVVGIFHTGIDAEDQSWGIVSLARQQAIQNRPRVINQIHIRLTDVTRSVPLAAEFERRWGFKSAPWEETYARVLDVFALQDKIMFLTTASILVVAAFGIFNVISTIVLEKARDIAIMRSIGLPGGSVAAIFLIEGIVIGVAGVALGWLAGWGLGALIHMVPAPTGNPGDRLPVRLTPFLFAAAGVIAVVSAVGAAWLPARKAARADPLSIIRGAA